MLNETQMRDVVGATAYDSAGDKIGKVGQLFLDDETGQPEFVTVNTGFFGSSESFVPVADAELSEGRLSVPFAKDRVKEAPTVDVDDGHLDRDQEATLYAYYGRPYAPSGTVGSPRGQVDSSAATHGSAAGRDESGADSAMTRSEERLEVGTATQEAGRARLRKYVTTEMETHTVPVRKERAVLETEPVTAENSEQATSGAEISEAEHEVVLHEERAVTQTVAEPVERVRLATEETTAEQEVSGEVRKEHIEAEGDIDRR
jgi:stress response protein YsnF